MRNFLHLAGSEAACLALAWPLCLLFTLSGCEASPTAAGPGGLPGPGPVSPLRPPSGSNGGGSPAPSTPPTPSLNSGVPAGAKLVSLSLNGDATRIVYPGAALTPGQRYPVVIFFHGSGRDVDQMLERTSFAAAAAKEGWLAASADLTGRTHWADDEALQATGRLIAELVANHQADPQRLYLVGFSMGGGTALLAAANGLKLPYRIAAVASSQGFSDLAAMQTNEAGGGAYAKLIDEAYGGRADAATLAAHSPLAQADKLRGIPLYLEHGEADTQVPVRHTRMLAEKLTALGIPATVRFYPGKGHGEETLDEAGIIAFFRGQAVTGPAL